MAVGIKDVAKLAGVTVGTVSRAFNGYVDIRMTTRNRIFQAAKELGYSPNASARNLSSKKNQNLGIVFSGMLGGHGAYHGEYVFKLLHGAYRYASELDLELAMYSIDRAYQQKRSYEQFCAEHSLSGTVFFQLQREDPYFFQISQSTTVPCVTVDLLINGVNLGCVAADEIRAFQEMTCSLFAAGHRKIMIIAGDKTAAPTLSRLAGAYEAFVSTGVPFRKSCVLYCNFSEEQAYTQVYNHVQTYAKTQTTAFICMSDIMAAGTIRALKDCGFRVPQDFSVTGYDGIGISAYTDPRLTTVDQNVEEKGYAAVELLHSMVKKPEAARTVYIPHKIITRDSILHI